jgi:hypothetical protein
MFDQIKNLKPGDVIINRSRRFTVKRIVVNQQTGMIDIIDTDDERHGPYHPDEYIGIEKRATGIGERPTPRNQFEILKQFATPEEKKADDEHELHNDGYCAGAPDCWLCQEEKERLQELEAKACACGHQKERHYWTKRNGEYVHLCRDCRECLGFERPDPDMGFTLEEIQSRWAYERQTEINKRAAVHLEPLREALRIKTVNFMLDAVFGPARRRSEQ